MNNLDGKWWVKVISGPLWFRLLKGDVKYISGDSGYNRIWGVKWGEFKVHRGIYNWIQLFYTGVRIIDRVWFVNSDKLKGEFFLNGKFTGQFTMERI